MFKYKVWKFVSSIITLVLGVICLIYCIRFKQSSMDNISGFESLSLLVTYPLFIMGLLISFGFLISSVFTSISCITSYSTIIRVFSIIFLIIAVCSIALLIDQALPIINIRKV